MGRICQTLLQFINTVISLIMAALRSRCGHYIFVLSCDFYLLSFYLFLFLA